MAIRKTEIGIGHNHPPESLPARRTYTVNEFSQAFRVSRPSIYRMIHDGQLHSGDPRRPAFDHQAPKPCCASHPRHAALVAVSRASSARGPHDVTGFFYRERQD